MSRGNRRRWSLWLARCHRYAGITAAVFTLLLALSGLLLQHAPALGLDRQPVNSPAVARWLGIDIASVRGWALDGQWLLAAGDGLWLDRQRIADTDGRVHGALTTPFGFAVAVGGSVRLFDGRGRPVERLRPGGALPAAVERIGRTPDGGAVVASGEGAWTAERNWLAFQRHAGPAPQWAQAAEPPAALAEAARRGELARSVDWERLLLALHSGRIAGAVGTVVMDAAALALIALVGTGAYLWWRRR